MLECHCRGYKAVLHQSSCLQAGQNVCSWPPAPWNTPHTPPAPPDCLQARTAACRNIAVWLAHTPLLADLEADPPPAGKDSSLHLLFCTMQDAIRSRLSQAPLPAGRDNSLHLLFSNMKYASLVESGSPGAVQTPPPAAPPAPAAPAAADSQTRPLLLPPAFFQGRTPGGQVRSFKYWVATVLGI